MTVTGRNDDVSILLPVDDAVGVVDTPTPPSAQISLQRLGLADALIGVPLNVFYEGVATVYKGNIIKNLIMDCQSYTKYRPNETTGGIFVSWRRKEELPTGA